MTKMSKKQQTASKNFLPHHLILPLVALAFNIQARLNAQAP
jgi:hypothetical protein